VDFIDACKVILRRWYVAVPLLLLTFAGTYFAYTTASANYSAKGSLILILPPARALGEGENAQFCPTNPWCAGSDVLSLANVTARTMDDPDVAEQILDPHPGADYDVVLNADNRSSIMELTATAPTPQEALATLEELRGQVEKELNDRQIERDGAVDESVSRLDLVRASPVTMANQARPQSGGKLRAAAAAFALGIAMTLGGTFLAESIAVSRRAKASLLDRIALSDQPVRTPASKKPTVPEAEAPIETQAPTETDDRPKPVTVGRGRSGRVGS